MKIQVTKEHIKAGKKGDCHLCPIALAIEEQQGCTVTVFYKFAYLDNLRKRLPASAVKFIELFDKKKSFVKPFEFEL